MEFDRICRRQTKYATLDRLLARLLRRAIMLGLTMTCRKLKVSFFRYLGDRLHGPAVGTIPPLPDLVRQAAPA